ncbi:MAG: alpha/beta fold hydrolase [Rhodospirillales bacterium]|nr:alpha/beta fold hydrolase [Rhodospirillales bacterium]
MKMWIKGAVLGAVLASTSMSGTAFANATSTLYDVGYRTHDLVVQDFYARPGSPDHIRLNYREWYSPSATDVLVYVHGMQSHSQWFNESGDELAARGFNVYAVDRRGSGLSGGKRGHIYTPFQWIADLAQVIGFVRAKNPGKHLHLMGNSFGGRLVMTYAEAFPDTIDTLILETPATAGRVSLPAEEIIEAQYYMWKYYPTPLHDDLFTSNPDKLAFMAQDKLGIRRITANMYKMEGLINVGNLMPQNMARITMPLLMLLSNNDRIVDTPAVISGVYDRVASIKKKLVRYDDVEHYLLFEDKHEEVLNEIANWMNSFTPPAARAFAPVKAATALAGDEEAGNWIDDVREEADRMGWSPEPAK